MSKVLRVADLSLTGPLPLRFAFFHRLDTPVLPHFISPHISFTPPHLVHTYHKYFHNADCRWQIPSQTPSHPTVPLTDPLTPHSPAHRSPYRPPSHLTDFSQILITDLSWLPRVSPRHPTSRKLPQCFSTLVYHRSSRVSVAGDRKLQFYLLNCKFSHRRFPLRGERNL